MTNEIVRVRITWVYETEVPREYLTNGNIDDVAMEAFTQGDGEQTITTIEKTLECPSCSEGINLADNKSEQYPGCLKCPNCFRTWALIDGKLTSDRL